MSTRRGPKPLDLAGKAFGWLTVIELTGGSNHYGLKWLVRCHCGKELELGASEITRKAKRPSQAPRSCGCYYKTHRSPKYKGVGDLSKSKWLSLQASAKRRGLEFTVSLESAWKLFLQQDKKCALSGIPLIMSPSLAAGANTASLDRIDNDHGYVDGNIQWVHIELNDMKSNYPEAEFVDWCCRVAHYSYYGVPYGIARGSEFGTPPKGKKPYVY
jgi:hypothetical protein